MNKFESSHHPSTSHATPHTFTCGEASMSMDHIKQVGEVGHFLGNYVKTSFVSEEEGYGKGYGKFSSFKITKVLAGP